VQFNYSFIWGDTIDISASIYGESSVGLRTGIDGVNSASGVVDSQHTFGWQGLSNVQDEFGNLVDYSVTSDSGTDWSMPANVVPIPAAVYLFGSGLALLGWFRRRKEE
jgi:hypothetical protein